MATYIPVVSSGSAMASTDLGVVGAGVTVTGAFVGINPTHLAYGYYSVDASGNIGVIGAARSSAAYADGTTKGMLLLGVATGGATATYGAGRMHGVMLDLSGNLRVALTGNTIGISGSATVSGNVSATQVGTWSVSGNALTAFISGSATVSGNVSATQVGTWAVSGTALTAYVSGQVSAVQTTSPWVVSANNTLTVATHAVTLATTTAFISGTATVSGNVSATQVTSPWIVSGNVSATQVTSPWVVSANNTLTVGTHAVTLATTTAFISGTATVSGNVSATQVGTWNVSGNVSATQVTSPWVVSLATTTAFISGTATVSGNVTATIGSASIAQITANAGTLGNVFVSSTATQVIAANTSRKSIVLMNNGSVNIWIGTSTAVTTAGAASGGMLLTPSGTYTDAGWGLYTGALWAVTTGASATAFYWERV